MKDAVRASIRFEKTRVAVHCEAAGVKHQSRTIGEGDFERCGGWIDTYRNAIGKKDAAETFLNIGQDMYDWLNGGVGIMDRLAGVDRMLVADFIVAGGRRGRETLRFLEAPWELLADESGHLAADEYLKFCPVRRIGEPGEPDEPSPYRLSVVFMAAEPRDSNVPLSYEAEEAAIVGAAGGIGLDLSVEESGTLKFLAERMSREKPDALHISCHGNNASEPLLNLADEMGGSAPASASELDEALGGHKPRLLFLSACLSSAPGEGQSDAFVASLAGAMIRYGCPAVLGWGGSVDDREASRFAADLYGFLARQADLETAAARARHKLLSPKNSPAGPSESWHMARLWAGKTGGGRLCGGDIPRRPGSPDSGHREFLDKKGRRVPVARYHEFVGRRRKIQAVLREFGQPSRAGVLIRGFGGLGKSSLAARIANRMNPAAVVVFGGPGEIHKYGASDIMLSIRDEVNLEEVSKTAEARFDEIARSPIILGDILRGLLEGPCSGFVENSRPVLMIIDDFEKVLEKPSGGGRHMVSHEFSDTVRAVIRAFDGARTRSRLIITSRYAFTLPSDRDDDMAARRQYHNVRQDVPF